MTIIFYQLISNLQATLETLMRLESAVIKEGDLRLMNDILIIHKDLFAILEKIEWINSQVRRS